MIASDQRSLYIRPSSAFPKLSTSESGEIRRTLEEGPDVARIITLKSLLVSLINGERELVEGLVMTLIRFVLPLKDKTIKKLLLLLFENMNKTDSEGNLKQEFILVWYERKRDKKNNCINLCVLVIPGEMICNILMNMFVEQLYASCVIYVNLNYLNH